MRICKTFVSLLLAGVLLCFGCFSSLAETPSATLSEPAVIGLAAEDVSPAVQPRYVPACGSHATHDMLSAGWGSIYNVDTNQYVVSGGACFQCTRCYLVLVCQGEPTLGEACGYYTTWALGEKLTSTSTVIRQSSANILYTSSSSIPGCTFRDKIL